jgi:hypothetical protein
MLCAGRASSKLIYGQAGNTRGINELAVYSLRKERLSGGAEGYLGFHSFGAIRIA